MKKVALMVAMGALIALVGCGSSSKPAASADQPAAAASQGKVYSMDDVNQELTAGGVTSGATQDTVRSFFKDHSAYQVCKDDDGGLIAVMKNTKVDPKSDDQYIVILYRDAKVASLDIGPPQFSVGNVASYCH